MKAARYHGQRDIRIEDVADPICGSHDVVIQTAACGVCGTDLSAFEHGSLFTSVGQIMGHEFSGRAIEVGSDVVGIEVGDRLTSWPIVHCDRCPRCAEGNWHLCENAWDQSISNGLPGGFAECVRIPQARLNRTVYRLPDTVSWTAGAMVEPLSVGFSAARFAATESTETAVVFGLGMIGLGVVQALALSGVRHIIGVDTIASRRDMAVKLGAERVLGAPGDDAATAIVEMTGAGPLGSAHVDVIFECTGAEAALRQAIQLIRPAGRLVLVGLPATPPTVDTNSLIVKQVVVRGTFAYRTEYAVVLSTLADGRLLADTLATHHFGLADIHAAFDAQADRDHALKVMVTGGAYA